MDQECENMILVLKGLRENKGITYFCVKLFYGNYMAGEDDIVFNDQNEEMCNEFENVLVGNETLEHLAFINLRFQTNIIESLGKGLAKNKQLKILNLQGNLFVLYCFYFIIF